MPTELSITGRVLQPCHSGQRRTDLSPAPAPTGSRRNRPLPAPPPPTADCSLARLPKLMAESSGYHSSLALSGCYPVLPGPSRLLPGPPGPSRLLPGPLWSLTATTRSALVPGGCYPVRAGPRRLLHGPLWSRRMLHGPLWSRRMLLYGPLQGLLEHANCGGCSLRGEAASPAVESKLWHCGGQTVSSCLLKRSFSRWWMTNEVKGLQFLVIYV